MPLNLLDDRYLLIKSDDGEQNPQIVKIPQLAKRRGNCSTKLIGGQGPVNSTWIITVRNYKLQRDDNWPNEEEIEPLN